MQPLMQPDSSLIQSYRLGLDRRLLCYALSAVCFLVAYAFISHTVAELAFLSTAFSLGCVLALVCFCCGAYIVSFATRHRIIIGQEGITEQGVWSSVYLRYEDILGYHREASDLILEPCDEAKPRIEVSDYLQGTDALILWLTTNFERVEQDEYEMLQAELSESGYYLREKAADNIAKARRWRRGVQLFKWSCLALAVVSLYWGSAAQGARLSLAIILPLIALVCYHITRGSVHIYSDANSPYPSMDTTTYTGVVWLFFDMWRRILLVDYSRVLLPVCTIAIVWTLLFLWYDFRLISKRPWHSLYLFFVVLATGLPYAYGVVTLGNYLFDKSTPHTERVAVVKKYEKEGKGGDYHLELSPWGNQQEGEELHVSAETYERLSVGDTVNVYIYEGRFDIPYYEVRED